MNRSVSRSVGQSVSQLSRRCVIALTYQFSLTNDSHYLEFQLIWKRKAGRPLFIRRAVLLISRVSYQLALTKKRQHSNLLTVANLPLVIISVDKPNIGIN